APTSSGWPCWPPASPCGAGPGGRWPSPAWASPPSGWWPRCSSPPERWRSDVAAWARPTARAVPWSSLAAAAAGLLGLVLVVAVTDAPPLPGSVAAVGAALLVAALAVCLHDPAHALLAALPTSPRRRTARRL